ncbi:MAG: hypothetical protein AAF429_04120 [Pseudomonadota bacterium]
MASKRKIITIHIGPHKTGSTALQKYLYQNSESIQEKWNYELIPNDWARDCALHLARNELKQARQSLKILQEEILEDTGDRFLMSSEDFCGLCPGRRGSKGLYAKIVRNLNYIRTNLNKLDVKFVFFVRSFESWKTSVFHQNIKYSYKFSSRDQFEKLLKLPNDWNELIEVLKSNFGSEIEIAEYSAEANILVKNFAKAVGVPVSKSALPIKIKHYNRGLTPLEEKAYLQIARVKPSHNALKNFRSLHKTLPKKGELNKPKLQKRYLTYFSELLERSRLKARFQKQPCLLPRVNCNLDRYCHDFIDPTTEFKNYERRQMEDQEVLLKFAFKGQPKILYLNALCISYLRRNTDHTDKALKLFRRIWAEKADVMLAFSNARWLISSLQTFADHPASESQRTTATAGFIFANTIKIYEAERNLNDLSPNEGYKRLRPEGAKSVPGLDHIGVGRSDIIPNTLAFLIEVARGDEISGSILLEFLSRVRENHSVFSRFDNERIKHDVNIPPFTNCWSFGVKP